MSLSKEYAASIVFFDQAQKSLRKIYSDCEYDKDCFNENSETHIKNDFCPKYKEYNFVSESECNRAGQGVRDLVSGENELAVPIRNTAQDSHNNRMYELEKEKLSQLETQRRDQQKQELDKERRQRQAQQRQDQQKQERIRQGQQRRERIRNLIKACSSNRGACWENCRRINKLELGDFDFGGCDYNCSSEYRSCEARAKATQ